MNIDGDRAAAAVAAALDAEDLVILSDVPGLLRDRADHSTLVPGLAESEMDEAMTLAAGSMRKKLLGAREALAGGVPRVILGLGREEAPIRRALAGQGTVIETGTREPAHTQNSLRLRSGEGRSDLAIFGTAENGRDAADCGRLEEPAAPASLPFGSMTGSGGTNVAFQSGMVQSDNMRPQSLVAAIRPQSEAQWEAFR
jgi:hypothetical protein